MDALDWSKQFTVFAISRRQLESLGIAHKEVLYLTDEDMARIAASIAKTYPDFESRVRINVLTYLLK